VAWTQRSQLELLAEDPEGCGQIWNKRDMDGVRQFFDMPYVSEDVPLYPASALTSLMEENAALQRSVDAFEADAECNNANVARLKRYEDETRDLKVMLAAAEARAQAAEQQVKDAVKVLEPFVSAFTKARVRYAARYADHVEVGITNFDKMPDHWPMDTLVFTMGDFRAVERFIKEAGE
jgi:hypothetical protein